MAREEPDAVGGRERGRGRIGMGGGHIVAFVLKQQKATLELSFPLLRLLSSWSLFSRALSRTHPINLSNS